MVQGLGVGADVLLSGPTHPLLACKVDLPMHAQVSNVKKAAKKCTGEKHKEGKGVCRPISAHTLGPGELGPTHACAATPADGTPALVQPLDAWPAADTSLQCTG